MPKYELLGDSGLDRGMVAKALGTESRRVRDLAYGDGSQFFAARGRVKIEVFPQTGVTRFVGQSFSIELFGHTTVRPSDSGVEILRQGSVEDARGVLSNVAMTLTIVAREPVGGHSAGVPTE